MRTGSDSVESVCMCVRLFRLKLLNHRGYELYYRPHPKDGEGNSFTLLVCPRGGGVRSSQGGVRSSCGGGQVQLPGGGVRSSCQGGGQVQLPGGGQVQRGEVRSSCWGGSGVQLRGGGSGPAGGGVRSSGVGGQHLAPSCGRYASCVHAGGLSCFEYKDAY